MTRLVPDRVTADSRPRRARELFLQAVADLEGSPVLGDLQALRTLGPWSPNPAPDEWSGWPVGLAPGDVPGLVGGPGLTAEQWTALWAWALRWWLVEVADEGPRVAAGWVLQRAAWALMEWDLGVTEPGRWGEGPPVVTWGPVLGVGLRRFAAGVGYDPSRDSWADVRRAIIAEVDEWGRCVQAKYRVGIAPGLEAVEKEMEQLRQNRTPGVVGVHRLRELGRSAAVLRRKLGGFAMADEGPSRSCCGRPLVWRFAAFARWQCVGHRQVALAGEYKAAKNTISAEIRRAADEVGLRKRPAGAETVPVVHSGKTFPDAETV